MIKCKKKLIILSIMNHYYDIVYFLMDKLHNSIYQKHQSVFVTEEDKYNVDLNSDNLFGYGGHIESILISWQLPIDEHDNVNLICHKSKLIFNPNTHWHCDLCCIQNECHIVNNKDKCRGCTCYTNIAIDYDLVNDDVLKYSYVWKTYEGYIIEGEECILFIE